MQAIKELEALFVTCARCGDIFKESVWVVLNDTGTLDEGQAVAVLKYMMKLHLAHVH